MRIFPKLTLLFTVFFLTVSGISAQKKKVTNAEIDKLYAAARENLRHISYREKLSTLDYRDNRNTPYLSHIQTTERLPSDRIHAISVKKFGKENVFNAEWIRIGMNRYLKSNDGTWKIEEPPFKDYGYNSIIESIQMEEASVKCGSSDLEYFGAYITKKCDSVGVEKIGKQSTHVYRATTTRTFKRSRPEGRDSVGLEVKTFWLDKNGKFLKIETIRTRDASPQSLWRAVLEYEYNQIIKIEAPIK